MTYGLGREGEGQAMPWPTVIMEQVDERFPFHDWVRMRHVAAGQAARPERGRREWVR